jgi:hypothetical protein
MAPGIDSAARLREGRAGDRPGARKPLILQGEMVNFGVSMTVDTPSSVAIVRAFRRQPDLSRRGGKLPWKTHTSSLLWQP